MKKYIALLLLGAMVLGLLSGCAGEETAHVPTGDAIVLEGQDPEDIMPTEENTQELTLAYYPDRSLNPLFGSDYTNRVLMSLMYQGLFAVDNKKNVTPILCSSYRSSANNRTWTFYIEDNATFSDGTRVTAADVVATYQKAMENDYYKHRFYHVAEVKPSDDGGVTFYLDTDMANFPMLLDVAIVKAAEVEAQIPTGTGPYIFSDNVGGATLVRVPTWWCGSLKIPATDESITLVEVSSVADVRDAFQFGGVSVVCTNPMSATFAEYRCDYELWQVESGYFLYIGCNVTYSDHFEDGTLRTFLTYAIDRATLSQDHYGGRVSTVTLPCSPTETYYNRTLADKYEYDSLKFIDKMRGYKIPQKEKGGNKEMRLLVNSDDSARVQIARDIAAALTDLGLPTTTLECSGSTYKDVLYYSNFDIYLGMTRLSPTMDLTEFYRPYGNLGGGGLANETLYNMVKLSLEDTGNFYNLFKIVAEDGRVIPVMFGCYNIYAQRGLMPDLNPSRDNVFYYSMGKSMKDCRLETKYE